MPFQSEKQRRYLWANEPKIARDWADTYGSRIKKDDGGISQLVKSGPGRPGYNGQGDYTPDRSPKGGPPGTGGAPGGGASKELLTGQIDKGQTTAYKGARGDALKKTASGDYKEKTFKDKFKQKTSDYRKKELRKLFDYIHGGRKMQFPGWSSLTRKADWDDEDYLSWDPRGASLHGDMSGKDLQKLQDLQAALGYSNLSQTGKFKGENKFAFEDFYPNVNQQSAGGGGGDGQGGGYMGYPSYEAWKAAQGTGATAAVPEQLSAFQQSLTAGANNPFDYYVGKDPGAKNLAWGKQMGVDPRTMGLTSFAADGGRIPAAFGGIMDTATGRRAYGFGSIFKKIGRAAKKVLKSPIGKAALIGGLGLASNAGWFSKMGMGNMGKGWVGALKTAAKNKPWLGKMLLNKDQGWSLGKLGIMGAGALPLLGFGQPDEDEDSKFDYEGAKNAYRDEMMRIKAGAMAGTLDPNKFNYLGVKDGGRIGLSNGGDPLLREEYNKYVFEMEEMGITPMSFEDFAAQARAGMYAGGQSTPSDYTMEDAMMTTTQDKLGGITDVMKQADLHRQGSVGQFYAAQGGRIGYAGGSGRPPVTMGQAPQMPAQPPQAPQRPNPMPAPQPNRMGGMPGGMNPMMGGMHPMMNRPMMGGMPRGMPRGMPARRRAQEGGLMDLGGMEKDYRQEGGFVPLGGEEKADDVPARLSKNEFVFTADAVRGAGDGDIDKGAEIMENIMKNLEQGGQISEETQGLSGAQEMFGVSERLSEVV